MAKKSSLKSKPAKKGKSSIGARWNKFRQSKFALPVIFVAMVGIIGAITLVSSSALTRISPPQNLTATPATSTQIDLKWWPSPTDGINGYRVIRDGVHIGSVTVYITFDGSISYQDKELTPNTQYSYRIEAYQEELVASTPTVTVSTFAATPADQLGTVSGIVTAKKKPVSNATVSIYYDRQSHKVTTGSDGKFTLNNVPEGRYTLSTKADGYNNASNKIRVKGAATTNVTVNLRQAR